ncbi:MAG: DNA glycosylase AlkZ-like family protein, partial [Chloroflexota bacterium]
LVAYHFAPTDVSGVLERLGTVQYDPLNPVGRNPDLVFQARVPGYRVDDWQRHAYQDRLMYDAWDKQACLVPVADWPRRAQIRKHYLAWHDRTVLEEHPDAVLHALKAIDNRGPLSSLEFEDRTRILDEESWYGPTRIKRILRALWLRGVLVTHHREGSRHYYDRPARVIPPDIFQKRALSAAAYHRWIVLRRHQAAGMLRVTAEQAIWSACGDAATRVESIRQLVEAGKLIPVQVATQRSVYHATPALLNRVEHPGEPRLIFLGPLDSLVWDRTAVRQIFGFDYAWEVYKPLAARRWGYYVLPVLFGDRFVGRMDAQMRNGILTVARWWWEADADLLSMAVEALPHAMNEFAQYLGAREIALTEPVDPLVYLALSKMAA